MYQRVFIICLLALICGVLCREYSRIDGSNNNKKHPQFGSVYTPLKRFEGNSYLDGISEIDSTRPNPRVISNTLFSRRTAFRNESRPISDLHTYFGQFLTHDIVLTRAPTDNNYPGGEEVVIEVPTGDPWFDPLEEGGKSLKIFRSAYTNTSGVTTPREFVNFITHFIDGSAIYGSTPDRLSAIRNSTHPAYLATSRNKLGQEMLPFNVDGLDNENPTKRVPEKYMYLAGDIRCNENPVLTSIHTIFMREHNRLAHSLKKNHSSWDSDKIFNEARRRVIAIQQAIVFNEYVAVILGAPLPEYKGYNSSIDPSISEFFASVAFRYGHSETNSVLHRVDESRVLEEPLLLRDVFHNPPRWANGGIEPILRGAVTQRQQEVDTAYIDDLRNLLFGLPGNGGTDLASINIMRGRDHGSWLYNDARDFYGLKRVKHFNDTISDKKVCKLLEELYGHPDNADSYVAGLAEDHIGNSNLGPLFSAALLEQYVRLRDGDRFYYENSKDSGFSKDEIKEITATTIAELIIRNSEIYQMPCSSFYVSDTLDCGTAPPSPELNVTEGQNKAEFLGGKVVISWTIDQEEITITLIGKTDGWVGLGFSTNSGSMLESDAVIVTAQGSSGTATDYYIGSVRKAGCPGVCADTDQGGKNDVKLVEASENGGTTTVTFTRPLDSGDKKDVAIVDDGNPTAIIVAFGSSDSIGYHGGNKEAGEINFYTGEVGTVPLETDGAPYDRLTVHGVLMFFAWTVVFPLGMFIVKFCKTILLRWWFRLHMLIQYLGVLIVIVALILAVEAVATIGNTHIGTTHSILGVISMCFAIVVPALGQLTSLVWSPTRRYAIFPDWLHYATGYAAPILAFVTIFFGIKERTERDDVSWYWYFLAALWIAIIVVVYMTLWAILLIYEIFVRLRKKPEEPEDEDQENQEEENWSSSESGDE